MPKYIIEEINNDHCAIIMIDSAATIIEKFKTFTECDCFLNNYAMNSCLLRLMKLGFSEKQSLSIIQGMESCHDAGVDAGELYTSFEKESLPDAIDVIEKNLKD
jgi:hypothetical protein